MKFVNSPEVQFSSSGTTVVLSGNFNWANNTALFNGAFIQNLNADVSVVADKNITLKLSAGSLNVKIINSSGISITPAQVAQAVILFFFFEKVVTLTFFLFKDDL